MSWTEDDRTAPSLGEVQALAEAARAALPAAFRPAARAVAIRVVEYADEEVLRELGIDDPFGLTGLYDGIPLTEKSVMD
ncbi:MAG TPA: neutral zinc metallopeptidase, partial [Rhodobacteraceae bacterium]|nr:neutral zinc metallopeptidase [Paracoccaceae bacterium]